MDKNNIEKILAKPLNIEINDDPFVSKGFFGMISGLETGDLVRLCESEVIQGCRFNKVDMSFYVMALEAIHESLMTSLDDTDKQLLERMRKCSKIITTHVDKINGDDLEGGQDEE